VTRLYRKRKKKNPAKLEPPAHSTPATTSKKKETKSKDIYVLDATEIQTKKKACHSRYNSKKAGPSKTNPATV